MDNALQHIAVHSHWRKLVNMTAKELRRWQADPRCKLASTRTGHEMLVKNIRLASTPFQKWTPQDWAAARKTINFIERHLAATALFGDEVRQSGWSKRAIALRNWGHDPSKRNSPAYLADSRWLRDHDASKRRHG